MKTFVLFFLTIILLAPVHAEPAKHYVAYAQFLEDTMVELSDGAKWSMDKGDCFPIYMFKDHQTKVILQLGRSTFLTDAHRIRVMKDAEAGQALESYKKNLESYLKTRPELTGKELKPGT